MSSLVENLLATILFGLIVAYVAQRMASKAAASA
jgi:hypothetical protein